MKEYLQVGSRWTPAGSRQNYNNNTLKLKKMMIHSLASKNSKIYQQYHQENNTSFKRWQVGVQISQNSFSFCLMIAAI